MRTGAFEDPLIAIANDALRRAMHNIASEKGDFTLFALFRRADAPGTWDLVVSAPWLESGKLKALGELVDLLAKSIGRAAFRTLSRVETVPGDNETVQYILKNIPVDDGEYHISSTDLFGLEIEEGIIFRAKRPGPNKLGMKGLHPAGGSSRGKG